MHIDSWLIFSSLAFVATMSPGPAILLVSSHSLQFGVPKSIVTILGNISGLFLMSACSVAGLSAMILASSLAFNVLKIVGALYLVYLGVKLWRNGLSGSFAAIGTDPDKRVLSLYRQGVFLSLTNPKAIVFTTALFPQFISVNDPLFPQFIILTFTFMGFSFGSLLFYSIVIRMAQKKSQGFFEHKWAGKIFGSAFVGFGVLLASSQG